MPEFMRIAEGQSYVMATPCCGEEDYLEIIYDLNYGSGPIGQQIYKVRLTPETFRSRSPEHEHSSSSRRRSEGSAPPALACISPIRISWCSARMGR